VLEFMLVCWNWGVVWDGRRPIASFEMIGHVTLPPFPLYSCLKVRPPSAR